MRISPTIAANRLRTLEGQSAKPNIHRAIQLAEHMGERIEITVQEALDVLHPGGSGEAKKKVLQRVAEEVHTCGADVELRVVGAKQFSGARTASFEAAHIAESEPRLPELGTVGGTFVDRQAATVQRDGKPLVRVLLNHSAKDAKTAVVLWRVLEECAAMDGTYRFEFWDFKDRPASPTGFSIGSRRRP